MTKKILDPQVAAMLEVRKQSDIPPMHTLAPSAAREIRNAIMIQSSGPIEEVAGQVVF